MKYIRTKDGIYELMPKIEQDYEVSFDNKTLELAYYTTKNDWVAKKDVINQADTIEDLMQVGDIVFYWYSNDDTEHCENIIRDWDIHRFKYTTLTRLLIPVNENDYRCVAKAESSFELISGRRYLVQKGVLKLL